MRFACDTGGTFTDLIAEDRNGELRMYKAPTTPADPVAGVLDVVAAAAADFDESVAHLLGRGEVFIHGTTHAINAIITGNTAKTAYLTTQGHPAVLTIREGGRLRPFDYTNEYPKPYVPRALTFEVPGRLDATGEELVPFDDDAVRAVIAELERAGVEALAVCLFWSIINPAHEIRVGELLEAHLPGVPFTLSHRLNPTLREYRRGSSAAIDASLKPLMTRYLDGLFGRLSEAGFKGRVLALTSQGGMMDASDLARTPIHAINSGPALAPIAGAHYNAAEGATENAIVADTGGTTYDVSLVRGGAIPWTRETWIGAPFLGHMTGFPSVDVRSIGAGGGSIARVDQGGLLHVGPESAGASPGPVCYGQGGCAPTVTDAALVLGYFDPSYFLGGTIRLDVDAARDALERHIATPLGKPVEYAAWSVINVATENMVQAITDITVNQGIDPSVASLIGGGGAAGLNAIFVARRLRCPQLIIPETGAALSAAGALMSELTNEYRTTIFSDSSAFDFDAVNAALDDLGQRCQQFIADSGRGSVEQRIDYAVEARYASQVWEIPVPLPSQRIAGAADLAELIEAFHRAHEEIFAIRDPESLIEFVSWSAKVRCRLRAESARGRLRITGGTGGGSRRRTVYFAQSGFVEAAVERFDTLEPDVIRRGPAIIESPFTTVVIDPDASFRSTDRGALIATP